MTDGNRNNPQIWPETRHEIKPEILWKGAVRVQVGYGFPERIGSPREALDYLKARWPVRNGSWYRRALDDCAACLEGLFPAERARQSFILASIEAEMLAGSDEPLTPFRDVA